MALGLEHGKLQHFPTCLFFFAKKDGNLDLVQEILRSEKLIFPFFFPTKNETTGSERRSGHVALRLEHVRPVRGQRAADAQPAHRPPRRLRERQPQLGQGQTGQKGRGRTHSPFGVLFWQRCTGFFFRLPSFLLSAGGGGLRVFTEFLPSFYRVFTEFLPSFTLSVDDFEASASRIFFFTSYCVLPSCCFLRSARLDPFWCRVFFRQRFTEFLPSFSSSVDYFEASASSIFIFSCYRVLPSFFLLTEEDKVGPTTIWDPRLATLVLEFWRWSYRVIVITRKVIFNGIYGHLRLWPGQKLFFIGALSFGSLSDIFTRFYLVFFLVRRVKEQEKAAVYF